MHGSEGNSLTIQSETTGSEGARLYYRFPGGRLEMAVAVANNVVANFESNTFENRKFLGDTDTLFLSS